MEIIHHRGEVQKADFEGITVKREEKLFVPEWGYFVPTAPYEEHFIFETPAARKRIGLSEYLCTCGAPAIVVSPEGGVGRLFACLVHATYGYHTTSMLDKEDFPAGEIITPKARKWPI